MFTPISRILILLFCAALSVAAAYFNLVTALIITSLISFVVLYGYFRKGTVMLALRYLRKEDYNEAERIIDMNKYPDKLDKKERAYYLFVKGFIAREKDHFEEAKIFLEEALQGSIKDQTDIAMAILALTDMEMVKNNKKAAKEYFLQIKDLKVSTELMPSVRKMQEWLGV